MANLVDMRDVSFTRGNRCIFDNISLTVPRGKITAIMGPSGIGKTTLLRLIGGQIAPDHGENRFDGENIPAMSRSRLYTVRKRMSMLFQSGALFTDMNVFDNVAYPLREHTQLPAPLLMKTGTFNQFIRGGIAFATPPGTPLAPKAQEGKHFLLQESEPKEWREWGTALPK